MSKPPLWLCKKCHRPLGEFCRGALKLIVHADVIVADGKTAVICPWSKCGEIAIWEPRPLKVGA